MQRYPQVLFFRHDNYSEIDSFIAGNKENFMCSIDVTNNIEDLNKLYNPNYHLLVTYGSYDECHACIAGIIPERFSGRWFHKTDISDIDEFNRNVNYCYITNVINCRELTRPVFSIFTTCFKSYDYIKTAYESIKNQTLIDWEWVIMDDTPEDSHFDFLKTILSADNRVRLYNRDRNSGNIGNVKNEVISLCRGKYILEMDHDDKILENCLKDAYNIFQSDDTIGFVYGDTIHQYRNGNNFKYDDFLCKGYGSYYMEKMGDKWIYVYNTPNINNITLSALVCLPNHPRIWKRSVLMECENYSEFLPICDDYEILLRTCCSKYKVVKNNKAQYIQYMNDGGNNFSNIRNVEINRIGPHYIGPLFYQKYNVHDKMKELGAWEDESYIDNHSPIWKREGYEHKKMNQRINLDYDKQYCIINGAIDDDKIIELYKNPRNDFLFLSNNMTHEELYGKLEAKGFTRMKCYSYDCSVEELVRFFEMMYVNDNCETEVIDRAINYLDSNTSLTARHEVINKIIDENDYTSYLEIGVENGITFKLINLDDSNKVGVDPDPTYKDNIILKTSDDFFLENKKMFDVVFIDGMHQAEYVYNDFFNALACLSEGGSIIIDDVLPKCEREQHKIPGKHFYSNGILKYGEPWTGDVWKFIYFLFLHYKFDSTVYNSTNNYRGMVHICNVDTNVDMSKIDVFAIINNYDFNTDYNKYVELIRCKMDSDKAVKLDLLDTEEIKNRFLTTPFNHVVLDNIIDEDMLNNALDEIKSIPVESLVPSNVYGVGRDVQLNKFSYTEFDNLIYISKIKNYLEGDIFISWLTEITGIQNLQKDVSMAGAGIHIMKNNGTLGIHSDFNIHHATGKYRRLNLLLYLNKEYDELFNGQLELWNSQMTKCEHKIPPIFNRIVLFRVDDNANHGHPALWKGKNDRISLALYYYTDDRPEHEKSECTTAVWKTIIN